MTNNPNSTNPTSVNRRQAIAGAEPRTLRDIVLNEEDVFRQVRDRAWLLHDRLCDGPPIEARGKCPYPASPMICWT